MELHLTTIIAKASSVVVVKKGVNQDAKTGAKRVQNMNVVKEKEFAGKLFFGLWCQ